MALWTGTALLLGSGTIAAHAAPESAYPHQLSDLEMSGPFVHVEESEGLYYLYGSSPNDVLEARTSPDLVRWSDPFEIFSIPQESWANPEDGISSPEVHRIDGSYYLVITLRDSTEITREFTSVGDPTRVPGYDANGACGECNKNRQVRQAAVLATSDSPGGPFTLLDPGASITWDVLMTRDGTLVVEDEAPYLVYAQDWVQSIDGLFESMQLTEDLSQAAQYESEPVLDDGTLRAVPRHMFRASDVTWYANAPAGIGQLPPYVAQSPQFLDLDDGTLVALWTTYADARQHLTQTFQVSDSGTLAGPWRPGHALLEPGHGSAQVFRTLSCHSPVAIVAHDDTPLTAAGSPTLELRHVVTASVEQFSIGGIFDPAAQADGCLPSVGEPVTVPATDVNTDDGEAIFVIAGHGQWAGSREVSVVVAEGEELLTHVEPGGEVEVRATGLGSGEHTWTVSVRDDDDWTQVTHGTFLIDVVNPPVLVLEHARLRPGEVQTIDGTRFPIGLSLDLLSEAFESPVGVTVGDDGSLTVDAPLRSDLPAGEYAVVADAGGVALAESMFTVIGAPSPSATDDPHEEPTTLDDPDGKLPSTGVSSIALVLIVLTLGGSGAVIMRRRATQATGGEL